eukprot:SAG31_NODE_1671_length_7565_cov_7.868203_4_plen_56_part_00
MCARRVTGYGGMLNLVGGGGCGGRARSAGWRDSRKNNAGTKFSAAAVVLNLVPYQ